jgi:hypothetical protein
MAKDILRPTTVWPVIGLLHAAEILAAFFIKPFDVAIAVDWFFLIAGILTSLGSGVMALDGVVSIPTGYGTIRRKRSPIAFWFNLIVFAASAHAMFLIGLVDIIHR